MGKFAYVRQWDGKSRYRFLKSKLKQIFARKFVEKKKTRKAAKIAPCLSKQRSDIGISIPNVNARFPVKCENLLKIEPTSSSIRIDLKLLNIPSNFQCVVKFIDCYL